MTAPSASRDATTTPSLRTRPPALLTHLAAAGVAALAASSAGAQVTVVNVNEDVGYAPGDLSSFTSALPGGSQFQVFTSSFFNNQANVSSRTIRLRSHPSSARGYLRMKTVTFNSLNAVVNSPKGQQFSQITKSANTLNSAGIALVSASSLKRGYTAGTQGYFDFQFQDATNPNQLDYGWINFAVTDDSYDNQTIHLGSYAYDLSGQELPAGATAVAPEPSPALTLAALSALTLGAAGVRRMKIRRE